jgi:serine/threonine protein kinase
LRFFLRTLGRLHELQTPHRDITPSNTYIGNRSALKLGDYGIAATAKLRRGVPADAFNP